MNDSNFQQELLKQGIWRILGDKYYWAPFNFNSSTFVHLDNDMRNTLQSQGGFFTNDEVGQDLDWWAPYKIPSNSHMETLVKKSKEKFLKSMHSWEQNQKLNLDRLWSQLHPQAQDWYFTHNNTLWEQWYQSIHQQNPPWNQLYPGTQQHYGYDENFFNYKKEVYNYNTKMSIFKSIKTSWQDKKTK